MSQCQALFWSLPAAAFGGSLVCAARGLYYDAVFAFLSGLVLVAFYYLAIDPRSIDR